jgi:exopolysaccharide biosynthesis predicted pyruvyltransferase EpsI/drug/metabolite transporter (DMT)-like permease
MATSTMHFLVQVAMWYFFSIMFNIEVKRIFMNYHIPWTVALMNFAIAAVGCASIMGKGRNTTEIEHHIDHPPSHSIPYLKLTIIGLLQFLGNFATNMSLASMSVSFTHVVKATEVVFVLAWSYGLVHVGILTRVVSITSSQFFVIFIITFGVVVASLQEATFSWHGLIFGLLANIGFSGRNTLAKWVMSNHNISKEYLFVIASFVSCVPCIFPMIFIELPVLLTIPKSVYLSLFYTSVMYFLYNTVSFTVLEGVTPVTHAIANCCKRLFIMVASLIAFRTVMEPLNLIGSLLAIFGVSMYSQLGPGTNFFTVLKKNIFLILVGSLLVGGILYAPGNPSFGYSVDTSSELDCPPTPPCEICPVLPPPKKLGNSEVIKHLQGEIVRLLGPHFKPYKKTVILDVPDHNNKGDSAIYTGEEMFLDLMNIELLYSCADEKKYMCDIPHILSIADPRDTIISLHGGGNFGDLWQWVVDARNGFVQKLLNHNFAFIMFPQTVTFKDEANIPATVDLFNKISDLTFAVRDEPSFKFIQKYFPTKKLIYMPDMAWMMGHKEVVKEPTYDVLFFLRTDHEGKQLSNEVHELVQKVRPSLKYKIDDWVMSDVVLGDKTLEELNYARFYAGLDFLTQAKVVITNRLHGHILSTLLDHPHVVVDNIYGKVFNNHKAWTMEATNVDMAPDIGEALAKALAMLAEIEGNRNITLV